MIILLQVHIALDDQSPENGGLIYIPGSHQWTCDGNPLPVLDFNFKDMEGIKVHFPFWFGCMACEARPEYYTLSFIGVVGVACM